MCSLCGRAYQDGDVMCGVRIGHKRDPNDRMLLLEPGKYVEGHYECVIGALTPEEVVKAMNSGQIPPAFEVERGREAWRRRREEELLDTQQA